MDKPSKVHAFLSFPLDVSKASTQTRYSKCSMARLDDYMEPLLDCYGKMIGAQRVCHCGPHLGAPM